MTGVQTCALPISKPPLFRIDAPARGKKPAAKFYLRYKKRQLRKVLRRLSRGLVVPKGKKPPRK